MKLFLIILAALVTFAIGLYAVNLWITANELSVPASQTFRNV